MKKHSHVEPKPHGTPPLANRPYPQLGPPAFESQGAPVGPQQKHPTPHAHGDAPHRHPLGKPAHHGHTLQRELARRAHPNFPSGPGGGHGEPDGDEMSPVTGGTLPNVVIPED